MVHFTVVKACLKESSLCVTRKRRIFEKPNERATLNRIPTNVAVIFIVTAKQKEQMTIDVAIKASIRQKKLFGDMEKPYLYKTTTSAHKGTAIAERLVPINTPAIPHILTNVTERTKFAKALKSGMYLPSLKSP